MAPPALQVIGITKAFPGVLANDHIDFALQKGEIHVLLGENGAGKTTLMNIIYGLYQQDKGQILLNGHEVKIVNPSAAIAHGIGMVHQHFMLVPPLTVAENIVLGVETVDRRTAFLGRLGLLDLAKAERRVSELSEQYGLQIDPRAYVRDLPVGTQQRVEIVKALYREADILILDEPTAVLTPQEANELFTIMRSLTSQGKSIIFITHKLKEVFAVADRITVLRNGRVVARPDGKTTLEPAETSEAELAAMMVGRDVALTMQVEPGQPQEVVLSVRDLRVLDDRHLVAVDGVSFDVRQGEVLGVAGVHGNGQRELVEALTGLRPVVAGQITLLGRDITHASPREITELGAAHIPEDRQKHGLVLSYPVKDNLVLNRYYREPFARRGVMDGAAITRNAETLVRRFDIRTPSVDTLEGNLSGGNQQKTIVAREFSRPIQLLIAAQPTRGLDVGSIEFIHRQLIERRDQGTAVLLISAELDEVLSLSDRIAVMFKGQIIRLLEREDLTGDEQAIRERLGLLMAGIA